MPARSRTWCTRCCWARAAPRARRPSGWSRRRASAAGSSSACAWPARTACAASARRDARSRGLEQGPCRVAARTRSRRARRAGRGRRRRRRARPVRLRPALGLGRSAARVGGQRAVPARPSGAPRSPPVRGPLAARAARGAGLAPPPTASWARACCSATPCRKSSPPRSSVPTRKACSIWKTCAPARGWTASCSRPGRCPP